MSDHDITAYCQEKFRQYDAHLAGSVAFRDKVNMIDASLGFLVKAVESYKNSDFTIKMSLIGIVFAILVQIGGFIYLWGRLTQTVENTAQRVQVLEDMHPRIK